MADIAERAQQQQEGQKTFLGILFSAPFHFLGVMFGSLGSVRKPKKYDFL